MKEDELFARLRETMRAERARLAAWERVARGDGEAPPPVPETDGGESSEDHARMAEACRPLGEAAADRILARLAGERRNAAAPASPASATSPAPVVDLAVARAKRRNRIALVAGPLAAAAAVVFFLRASGPATAPPGDALPEYAFTVSGGAAAVRGESAEGTKLTLGDSPDEVFRVVARPATAVASTATVYGRVFALRDGRAQALDIPVVTAANGSLLIRGSADLLRDATALRVVVGDHPITSDTDAHARVLTIPIVRAAR